MNKLKKFLYNISGGYSFAPYQFTINISNKCNRRCRFCPNFAPKLKPSYYLDWIRQQPDFMDYDKFEDFIKRMGIFRHWIKQLSITGRGETLLHPRILDFCKLAEKYRIWHHITTSGDFLTPELEQELSKLKYLRAVRVSLFEPKKAKYWLDRAKNSPINITFQNETGKHLEGFEDGFIAYNNPGTEKYCTMPKDFVTEDCCTAPFAFNTLNTDGTLVACITFIEAGNVFEEPFWRVWNSWQMRKTRKMALRMEIPEELAVCRSCGVFMRKEKYRKLNRYV